MHDRGEELARHYGPDHEKLKQAIEAWLAVAREEGLPIPEPRYRAPTRAAG